MRFDELFQNLRVQGYLLSQKMLVLASSEISERETSVVLSNSENASRSQIQENQRISEP
jgi:hypothetical protein